MKVLSVRLAWQLFVGAMLILVVIAYIGDRAAAQYAESETWVSHTREVESQIALLRADMAVASAARFQAAEDPAAMQRYQDAVTGVDALLNQLQFLTADNPVEQENVRQLRPAVAQRMSLIAAGVSPPEASTPPDQSYVAEESRAATATTNILESMRAEEESLLATRTVVSQQYYLRLRMVLGLGLLATFAVLIFTFRTLFEQLRAKAQAERSIRKLSAHILKIQDGERRRLARELHDGLGQTFAGLNMEMEVLARSSPLSPAQKESVDNAQKMAAEGLSQTRTISYLLHPPMLDEFGFEQAARWYVEGFSNRSKIAVDLKFTQPFKRLPESMELVLFRVIQEALTNVHRHSGSERAEIVATLHPDRVNLTVRDFGKGISGDLLKSIEESSSGAGVGLGGMRERVAELGGYLTLESNGGGTSVNVSLPFPADEEAYADGGPDAQAAAAHSRESKVRNRDFDPLPRVALDF
jgi:signal transduction histidine kinase